MFAHHDPSVLILTAIHNKPCVYQKGDHLNFMSVLNKQARSTLSSSSACLHSPPRWGQVPLMSWQLAQRPTSTTPSEQQGWHAALLLEAWSLPVARGRRAW